MDTEEYFQRLGRGEAVAGGSEMHQIMRRMTFAAMEITARLNTGYHPPEEVRALFSQLIGKPVDPGFALYPPFYTNCGKNITLGKNVFINFGCFFQDQGGIVLGDGALIGHGVVLATLNHHMAPELRSTMLPAPIRIGRNVWVGANATVLPGVTIGDGSVVAAGAVVNRDVPPNTVVGGVPARFIKKVPISSPSSRESGAVSGAVSEG